MKKLLSVFVVVMFVLSLGSVAMVQEKKEPAAPAQAKTPTFEKSDLVTVTATVEAIDLVTRMVTLKGPKGNTFTFKAGEQIKNLP